MAYIYVRFNGGLSYTHLSPREGPRCAQLRGAVLAGHLSLFGVRNAAEEFGLRDSEAPWVVVVLWLRWSLRCREKVHVFFFFWLFGLCGYMMGWCFVSFHEGFFCCFFGGWTNLGANLFVVWWGGRHFFFELPGSGCDLRIVGAVSPWKIITTERTPNIQKS